MQAFSLTCSDQVAYLRGPSALNEQLAPHTPTSAQCFFPFNPNAPYLIKGRMRRALQQPPSPHPPRHPLCSPRTGIDVLVLVLPYSLHIPYTGGSPCPDRAHRAEMCTSSSRATRIRASSRGQTEVWVEQTATVQSLAPPPTPKRLEKHDFFASRRALSVGGVVKLSRSCRLPWIAL